jgi:hypothetical protein
MLSCCLLVVEVCSVEETSTLYVSAHFAFWKCMNRRLSLYSTIFLEVRLLLPFGSG